jgi:asparagine synthase (glutamine-hydrolysing)
LQKLNPLFSLLENRSGAVGEKLKGKTHKVDRILSQISPRESLASRYSSIHSLTQSDELERILNPDFYSSSAQTRFIDEFNSGEMTSFNRMVRSDLQSYLPGDLLVKADTATMANSLELRSPLLDDTVVEWGLSLPYKYKVKGCETKHILKDIARSLVPAELIDRPKMGFGIPRAEWLRTEMKELTMDILTDTTALQRNWFDPIEVKKIIQVHMSGQNRDNIIWPMLMLELWARTWLD